MIQSQTYRPIRDISLSTNYTNRANARRTLNPQINLLSHDLPHISKFFLEESDELVGLLDKPMDAVTRIVQLHHKIFIVAKP